VQPLFQVVCWDGSYKKAGHCPAFLSVKLNLY